jgi:arabinofuranosyltransferase
LVLFLFVYLKYRISVSRLFLLSLLAALGTVNRMDTFLFFFPMLLYSLVILRFKGVCALVLGFLPFILWECFAILYYGFPFPNTAYAKLNAGIGTLELAEQGLRYLLSPIRTDPLTLLTIAIGATVAVLARERRVFFAAVGILLYLLYIVRIGGDFMTGRFLSAPLLVAVVLLSYAVFPSLKPQWLLALGVAVVLPGLALPYSPLLSDADYGLEQTAWERRKDGVGDERAFYYQASGLLGANGKSEWPSHRWERGGRLARIAGLPVVTQKGVGFFGFYAGPRVHVVDVHALAEPLLARLPIEDKINWRIGHFERKVPDGYVDTLVSGQNRISDRELAAYYEKLSVITRGNLFDVNRLTEIWNMNIGRYDDLVRSSRPASQ